MNQSDFYARLSEELIDNNFDGFSIRERKFDGIEIAFSLNEWSWRSYDPVQS